LVGSFAASDAAHAKVVSSEYTANAIRRSSAKTHAASDLAVRVEIVASCRMETWRVDSVVKNMDVVITRQKVTKTTVSAGVMFRIATVDEVGLKRHRGPKRSTSRGWLRERAITPSSKKTSDNGGRASITACVIGPTWAPLFLKGIVRNSWITSAMARRRS